MKNLTDLHLFTAMLNDDREAFSELFHRYYSLLCAFAFQRLGDEAKTEEIVQGLFVRIWEKRGQLQIRKSVKSYLFRALQNELVNLAEHRKVEQKYLETLRKENSAEADNQELPEIGLMQKIEEAIENLPPRRREIFRLSREAGLSYREIAEKCEISVKTVEAQMGLALRQLRDALKDYRHLLIGLSINKKIFRSK